VAGEGQKLTRLDYQGGVYNNNQFYLQICGFFDDPTALKSNFTRKNTKVRP
jgi:hypothetical protein